MDRVTASSKCRMTLLMFCTFDAEIFLLAELGKASIPEASPFATALGETNAPSFSNHKRETIVFIRIVTNNNGGPIADLAVMICIVFPRVGAFRIRDPATFLFSSVINSSMPRRPGSIAGASSCQQQTSSTLYKHVGEPKLSTSSSPSSSLLPQNIIRAPT